MVRKIFLVSIFLIGGMEGKGISDANLLKVVKNGKLTRRFIDRYHVDHAQLERVINGETLLTAAIKSQLPETFGILLDAGVNLKKQADGTVPLEVAVEFGTVPMVQDLLYREAHLTPRACRLSSKRGDMYRFFVDLFKNIKLGGEQDGKNRFNLTRVDVDQCLENMLLTTEAPRELQELLHEGVHTNYRDEKGDAAIDYAVQKCLNQNVKILINHASPEPRQNSVEMARTKCQKDLSGKTNVCCKTINVLEKTENRDWVYQQLIDDIKNRKLDKNFLKEYFKGLNGLNINRTFVELNNEDVLALAVHHCDYNAARLLLKYGASSVQYSFNIALKKCPKKLIQLLLDHGGKLYRSLRPLEQIIQFNPHAPSIIKWLAPDVSSHTRQDAFLFTCLKGTIGIAEILFNAGVGIDEVAKDGQSPLWNTLLSQNEPMLDWLLAHKAKNTLTPEQLQYMKNYFPAGYQRVVALRI